MLGRWKKGIAAADLDLGAEHVITLTDEDDYAAAGVLGTPGNDYDGSDEDNSHLHKQFGHLVSPEQVAAHEGEEVHDA